MADNSTIVNLTDGRQICLSYGVPVAAFIPPGFVTRPGLPRGYVKTAEKFSSTTSKHANRFTGARGTEVAAEDFAALVAPLTPDGRSR